MLLKVILHRTILKGAFKYVEVCLGEFNHILVYLFDESEFFMYHNTEICHLILGVGDL